MRDGNAHAHEALARRPRCPASTRDDLRVEEVADRLHAGIRWIICRDPEEAERSQAARDAAIARISAQLDRITTARTQAREQGHARRAASAAMSAGGPHEGRPQGRSRRGGARQGQAGCALRERPALGRWLRQTPSGRLVLDQAGSAAETRFDSECLLSTSDPDLSAEDVALGYKNLPRSRAPGSAT